MPRGSRPLHFAELAREGWEGRPVRTHWSQEPHKHSTFAEAPPSLPHAVLAPQRSSWWHRHKSGQPWRAHLTHPTPLIHLPLAQLPQLQTPFLPEPVPVPSSPAFSLSSSLRYFLGWLLSLSPSGPTWSMELPPTLTCSQPHWWNQDSEVGLDPSQLSAALSFPRGPLLGSRLLGVMCSSCGPSAVST